MTRNATLISLSLLLLAGAWVFAQNAQIPPAASEPAAPAISDSHRKTGQALLDGGIQFLLKAQDSDGSWALGKGSNKPAMTAMALKILLTHPGYGVKHPAVQAGLKSLLTYRQKDGGLYEPREGMYNYHNSIAIMTLAAAAKLDPQYKPILDDAVKYNRSLVIRPGDSNPKGEKIKEGEGDAGGVNYGKKTGRADLSNAGMWLDAMHDAGVKPDDADIQAVVGYVGRLQNSAELNKRDIIVEGPNDGGFIYAIMESKPGPGPGGKGLRSYGSMTYVGFKSMLYAGLKADDPRVRAAFDWIRRYWRLDSNPNMPELQSQEGLFYYYHVFAKALKVWGHPVIKDLKGVNHNWRNELIDALKQRVSPDGSWTNASASRWEEGNPLLATCFALLALQEAL